MTRLDRLVFLTWYGSLISNGILRNIGSLIPNGYLQYRGTLTFTGLLQLNVTLKTAGRLADFGYLALKV